MHKTIKGLVTDSTTKKPLAGAFVCARPLKSTDDFDETSPHIAWTGEDGRFSISVPEARGKNWEVKATFLGVASDCVPAAAGEEVPVPIDVGSAFEIKLYATKECGTPEECGTPLANRRYEVELCTGSAERSAVKSVVWHSKHAYISPMGDGFRADIEVPSPGDVEISATVTGSAFGTASLGSAAGGAAAGGATGGPTSFTKDANFMFRPSPTPGITRVALQRASVRPTREQGLWTLVRANSRAISFPEYHQFINRVLCKHSKDHEQSKYPTFEDDSKRFRREKDELVANFGVGAYELLRTATELFLLLNCRVATRRELPHGEFQDEELRRSGFTPANLGDLAQKFLGNNAYLRHVIEAAFPDDRISHNAFCDGVLTRTEPVLIELIWSYWHEEGMLAQSVNALARRFQNQRAEGPRDPLSHFELDPLRPLNNILWGYVQEEYKRLTVRRRSAEYDHQYGFCLYGKANPRTPTADTRSKFLESFHNLLHRCSQFFKEDNDTTVIADGFPLLNALREVHLILAQGAHNQFGDMAWTARVEMLMQQWIMARRETRDFLQSRAMVPYTEAWMPQVDTMKTVQGWTDVGVNHFRDLGFYGEQILLSIRYGDWVDINDEDVAKDWARFHRGVVQRYTDCYRSVVGQDLTKEDGVDYTVPAVHLKRRLDAQARAR